MLSSIKARWGLLLAVMGPGLVVMFADTDAGSIITAAQSGAVWGYKILPLQLILIPVLFFAQELTARLGLVTGMGHGELIKKRFGSFWAWLSVSTLILSCVGAILAEFSGIAGVGALFGIPRWESMLTVVTFLTIVAWTGSYLTVERIALMLGAFELVFVYVAWHARPTFSEIQASVQHIPFTNPSFLYLLASNIGAVIMPWMVFFQQSAVLDKGLTEKNLKPARWDTLIGAFITQLVMSAVLIATAATIGKTHPGTSLEDVHQISEALVPFLGVTTGRILFAMGMLGAALIAAIVVSLTAAWGLGEVMGYRRSLQDRPKEAPWFYGVYTLTLIIGGIVITSGINIVNLSVAVNVMNALLLPIVLGFLFMLAFKALPEKHRIKGWYAVFLAIVLGATALIGLFAGIYGGGS
jgi:NRAMP (natural resistance-associated macrophage protein)-like metal ion transporter